MAFDKFGLKIGRGGIYDGSTPQQFAEHSYKSATDSFATMTASGYFPDFLGADSDTVLIGDIISIQDSSFNTRRYAISFVSPITLITDPAENPFDQSLNTTDAVTFATVNTGQGSNELYAMDQNVRTTDNVTFGSGYIGGGSKDTVAAFQVDSTTQGVLDPRMTTTQRDAIATPPEGLRIFNTTTKQWEGYNGTSWVILG